jgi:hypothetical protein
LVQRWFLFVGTGVRKQAAESTAPAPGARSDRLGGGLKDRRCGGAAGRPIRQICCAMFLLGRQQHGATKSPAGNKVSLISLIIACGVTKALWSFP